MPSKKQRRRREKTRRHEFEEVYLDAEGNEITREEYEALVDDAATPAVAANGRASAAKPIQRGARTIHPPSWRRVFRRALLFAPLMAITLYFLSPDEASTPSIVVSTVYLMALFIPFSYFMDRLMYRRFAAKSGQAAKAAKR